MATITECKDVEHALNTIQSHEIDSNHRYSAYKCSKNFGCTPLQSARQVFWVDKKSVTVGRQDFTGIPFVILGMKGFDCQFGKDRKKKSKERRKAAKMVESDHHSYVKGKKFITGQDTKKMGCTAGCLLREIVRFPQYQTARPSTGTEGETEGAVTQTEGVVTQTNGQAMPIPEFTQTARPSTGTEGETEGAVTQTEGVVTQTIGQAMPRPGLADLQLPSTSGGERSAEQVLQDILSKRPTNKDVVQIGPHVITDTSLHHIEHYLSDEVIDSCLHMMISGSIYHQMDIINGQAIFSPQGRQEMTRYLPELQINDHDAIIGAVNEGGNHWVLLIIIPNAKMVVYMNPLGEPRRKMTAYEKRWRMFLTERAKLGIEDISTEGWEFSTVSHPKQLDSSSCGIFVLKGYSDGQST